MPKPPMLAADTESWRMSVSGSVWSAANRTVAVDSTQPATVNTQNGRISRRRWARPFLPQTQYLFSRKAGIDIMQAAVKFALSGSQFSPAFELKSCSRIWLPTTPTTDVAE